MHVAYTQDHLYRPRRMGLIRELLYGVPPGPIVRAAADLPSRTPAPTLGVPVATGSPVPAAGAGILPGSLLAMIDDAVTARLASFTLREALSLPSVVRAVQLLAGTVAQFTPLAYRDDVQLAVQPRVLRRPTPFGTRYDFLYATMYALLAGDANAQKAGNAFWLVTDRDDERQPRAVIQLPGSEVSVDWDDRRFLPRYRWRGRDLTPPDLIHVALGRAPGALLGVSPIVAALDALAQVDAAEQYAAAWFVTSGVPSVVLKSAQEKTPEEAAALKAQWLLAHSGPGQSPAVLSGGIEDSYPNVDPEGAQLQQTRDYGNTVVARLLGIPAALLHVATSGATITYTNPAGAIEELIKATIAPTYLPPIEGALSELVPSTQAVRLNTREVLRVDIAGRFALYQQGVAMGMLTAQDARALEGWSRTGPIGGDLFAAVPAAPPAPSRTEVPMP
jgi:HK97 family phage portal protein